MINFGDKELEFFGECISDQIETTMRGDWDAVKEDICFLPILMGKVMTLIINNDTETNDQIQRLRSSTQNISNQW